MPPKKLPGTRWGQEGIPFHTARRTALSPDGKSLAIGTDWEEALSMNHDEPVRLWDLATGTARLELKVPTNVLLANLASLIRLARFH